MQSSPTICSQVAAPIRSSGTAKYSSCQHSRRRQLGNVPYVHFLIQCLLKIPSGKRDFRGCFCSLNAKQPRDSLTGRFVLLPAAVPAVFEARRMAVLRRKQGTVGSKTPGSSRQKSLLPFARRGLLSIHPANAAAAGNSEMYRMYISSYSAC